MKLKIGTRRSKLALWQSNLVAKKLNALDVQTELVEIESFGDKEQDLPLHKLGDKGVFTKALDEALLDGKIDLAVHSLKDVPTIFEDGLQL
ncbi:MAG TPA: hydroxymethylbilane synthase, partial [Balneola sp.]|nr:hydroxymethylbilane synthase [Balneola sp.]